MISTTQTKDGLKFTDQSEDLVRENGKDLLVLVRGALRSGLESFTTPTTADGDGRIDWQSTRWVTMRNGKPVCFLVAYKTQNAHFEILGPEVSLGAPPKNGLREIA